MTLLESDSASTRKKSKKSKKKKGLLCFSREEPSVPTALKTTENCSIEESPGCTGKRAKKRGAGAAGPSTDTSQRGMDDEMMAIWSKKLIEREWYHGVMPRNECCELLENDGDFLVRKTTEKSVPFFCLTVLFKGQARHFPLFFENGGWTLRRLETTRKFPQLLDLLNFLAAEKRPLKPTTATLIRPVKQAKYYIQHDEIELIDKLGAGAFGEVWRGKFEKKGEEPIDVAVKKMKGETQKSKLRGFLKEAKLMRLLTHRNMVRVIGVAPMEEPLMIVIELAKNGCLKNHLRNKKCSIQKLTGFCRDTARGMAYLSSQTIIHRDLAARNLLLGAKMEVKISDFGLSESGLTEIKATKIKVPIRWLAPETIEQLIFTPKTDVWSFAVTMWEIFTFCATDPFPGLTNAEAKEIIKTKHPPMEISTNKKIHGLMCECFSRNPEKRPDFEGILKKLSPEEKNAVSR